MEVLLWGLLILNTGLGLLNLTLSRSTDRTGAGMLMLFTVPLALLVALMTLVVIFVIW